MVEGQKAKRLGAATPNRFFEAGPPTTVAVAGLSRASLQGNFSIADCS
jgi:hypothetical protein